MMKNIEGAQARTNKALSSLDAGFKSKAARQDAIGLLNRAYSMLQDAYRPMVWSLFKGDRHQQSDLDEFFSTTIQEYEVPFDLHHVRERHIAKVAELSEDISQRINFLVESRQAIKDAPIAAPTPKKEPSAYQVKAEKTLFELIELRKTQYLRAVELGRIFNGLPVTANTHLVINQYGTQYLRTFYFLYGELTPLNVIIAAAEKLAKETEAA